MFFLKSRNIDDPKTIENYHADLIQKKPYLRNIYIDFYKQLRLYISPLGNKVIVELGSGGGFIKEIVPQAITSDIMKLKNIDMQFSALDIPFEKNSVDAFLMIDVMHHVSDVRRMFNELNRCLKKGGKIIMIEPANTLWGGFIYKYFHHELFNPKAIWKFKPKGPMSSSNLSLPWIVFVRDRQIFERLFPYLKILNIKPHTPFMYLLSGGLRFPQLVPSFTYELFNNIEKLLKKFNPYIGMFYTIELKKNN
ncbi:MAG: class I SAM-dependent methyltransferase [Candidatus Levybacteria bacterium]|nr:class I SAM-dependent methyltransferase [Candidatus Levybacteria bacterium]